ncbi:class I SAM-dependent methyltransferase [Marisediminicola sp. LYQ134]|uniref:class I SAM-dependent methyltransferase n=1 Tax=unclassified Marisediminicola TaxID=2618316 RepID=UPI0039834C7E
MTDSPIDPALATSFDRAAEVYERARPSYPDAVVDWLVPADTVDALDLGAGTGKLTRALVSRGLHVVAVDPAPNMLAQLTAALPEVRAIAGSAESIPLAHASVDLVVVAQAWHWVDPVRAEPEVARVLRPGGSLALVWNVRDDRVGWVAELLGIIGEGGSNGLLDTPPRPAPPFEPADHVVVDWTHELDRAALLALVASRSTFIAAEPEQRAAVTSRVEGLLATHPDLAGREVFEMPYRTVCWRARLGV